MMIAELAGCNLRTGNTRLTRAKSPPGKLYVVARQCAVRPAGADGTAATAVAHREAIA